MLLNSVIIDWQYNILRPDDRQESGTLTQGFWQIVTMSSNKLINHRVNFIHAQYRGQGDLASHSGFDLEVHERFRQEAARQEQSGGSGPSA